MRARRFKPGVSRRPARQVRAQTVAQRQFVNHEQPSVSAALPVQSSNRAGEPPAHWLELVRTHAPGLLDGTGRGVLQLRPRPAPSVVRPTNLPAAAPTLPASPPLTYSPGAPSQPGTPLMVTPAEGVSAASSSLPQIAVKRPAQRMKLAFSENSATDQPPPSYTPAGRRRPQRFSVSSAPANTPAPAIRDTITLPSPTSAALSYSAAVPAAQTDWVAAPRVVSAAAPALQISPTESVASPDRHNVAEPTTVPVTAFPRYHEPPPLPHPTALPLQSPPAQRPPQAAFNDNPKQQHTATGVAPSQEGIWPSLPDTPAISQPDESSISRAWQRREQLNQEQRGATWSEPLS